jgi:S-adenosylmethionine decarboxylase
MRRIIRAMQGLHLTADLHDCPVAHAAMTEPDALRAVCLAAVRAAGLQPVGVTGVVLLAESHLAVHTWPEIAAVTLDVYVCNLGTDNSARAHALLEALISAFAPEHIERHALARGEARA